MIVTPIQNVQTMWDHLAALAMQDTVVVANLVQVNRHISQNFWLYVGPILLI